MRAPAPLAARLRADRSGVAALEFALALPIVLTIGLAGLEVANLAISSIRVSEIATTIADTAGRAGSSGDPTIALKETDILDIMNGAKDIGATMGFPANGRVILSDLEPKTDGSGQYIRWQRCYGMLNRTSSFGVPRDASGNAITDGSEPTTVSAAAQTKSVPTNGSAPTPTTGMGKSGQQIAASTNTAVMFVEVAYTYQPLVSNRWFGARTLFYTAAFNVRQRTDNSVSNSGGLTSAQKAACSRFYT